MAATPPDGRHYRAGPHRTGTVPRRTPPRLPVTADSLRPIGVWDAPDRDPRSRYVTVAYAAVVPADTQIVAGDDARKARWWPLDNLPGCLAFDHADILRAAITRAS